MNILKTRFTFLLDLCLDPVVTGSPRRRVNILSPDPLYRNIFHLQRCADFSPSVCSFVTNHMEERQK